MRKIFMVIPLILVNIYGSEFTSLSKGNYIISKLITCDTGYQGYKFKIFNDESSKHIEFNYCTNRVSQIIETTEEDEAEFLAYKEFLIKQKNEGTEPEEEEIEIEVN